MSTDTEWKKIPGVPTIFEASSIGQIRKLATTTEVADKLGRHYLRTRPERILTPRLITRQTATPNLYVRLYADGGRANWEARVAYLVAKAHLGPPPGNNLGAIRIDFRDGDPKNCAVSNLQWMHQVKLGGIVTKDAQDFYAGNLARWREVCGETHEQWSDRVLGLNYWENE